MGNLEEIEYQSLLLRAKSEGAECSGGDTADMPTEFV